MFIEKTSLIIPTKDRPHKIFRILKSIRVSIDFFNEILIIDSSKKGNNKMITKALKKYNNIKIIHSKPSISLQRNIGLQKFRRSNQFIMFCDDDIIFKANSISYMNEFIKRFPNNVGYGFNLIEKQNSTKFNLLKHSKFFQNNGYYHRNPGMVCKNGWHTKISNLKSDAETMWLSTQACIYKSNYIKNYLSFDRSLGKYSYLDDLFFSYKLSKKGKLSVCSRAKYLHPDNIERKNYNFGIKEIVNRYKFVKINHLNIKKFYISAFLKSISNLLNIFLLRLDKLPQFLGNLIGIILCFKNKK